MEVPKKIAAEYKRLRSRYPFFVSLKVINGKYYLYKQITRRDKATKKTKIRTTYLGRITEDGSFIEKGSKVDYDLENAVRIIEASGGKVLLQPVEKGTQQELPIIEDIDKKILTALSMNSRMKLSKMSRIVGLSKGKLVRRMKRLETLLGIRYTAEIDAGKLGYRGYIVFAKFRDQKPSEEVIRGALVNEPKVQLGMLTRGIYDLVIYLLVENENDLSDIIAKIRSYEGISAYKSDWYATSLYETYGFMPLREKFFEALEERVWKRTKESPRPTGWQLYNRDYLVLKEINSNSVVKFTDLDAKYGFERGAAKYSYHARLEGPGIITRPTITMAKPGVRYNAVIIMGIEMRKEFTESRKKLWYYEIEDTGNITNKLSFLADIKVPNGVLLLMPIYKDGDLEREEEELKSEVKGINVNSLVVTDVVVGDLCYRKFDDMYSSLYEGLIAQFNEKLSQDKIKY